MTLLNKTGTQVAFEGPSDVDDPEGYYYDADSRRNVVSHVCTLLLLFFLFSTSLIDDALNW